MAICIEQAHYILADVARNNNKFWKIELHDDDTVRTQWGRVGDEGQSKTFANAGQPLFDLKRREKANKGYQPVHTLDNEETAQNEELAAVAAQQIATDNDEAAALIARLWQANVHNILDKTMMQYDTSKGTFATPLGIVTQMAIDEARNLLTEMGQWVADSRHDAPEFAKLVSRYLMLVPQNIGRGKPDLQKLYPDANALQTQNGILDALEASLQNVLATAQRTNPDAPLFDVRLSRVYEEAEIARIRTKYRQTQQGMHACAHLDVKAVYAVEVGPMKRDFEAQGRQVGNVMELWHGTKVANLLSILRAGLRVAPPRSAYITGKVFGNGVYFSDQSTKALNYAYGYWDGSRQDNCFMMLCDVAMGRPYTAKCAWEALPKPDFDSTFAEAGKSGVANNEMIVYRNEQINIRYIVEFSPNGK